MKRIFVSSTFRDMQYERDLFHTVITPKLNGYAREYGESVSFCDLRWGVNTSELESEEGARKVLSVCLNEIDRCDQSGSMPYIVVLIGNRYGWIPDKSLIKNAAQKKNFDIDDVERSVTALEIEYGALRDSEHLSRTLFYFREFEDEIPKDSKYAVDGDTDDERDYYKKRLNELKEQIKAETGSSIKTYCVKLGEDGETILGLESFTEMVTKDIQQLMEKEWREYAMLSPHQKIVRSQWNISEQKAAQFGARENIVDDIIDTFHKDHTIISVQGKTGSGKSTLLSRLAYKLKADGADVIPIFCGSRIELNDAVDVLRYIVYELENRMNLPHIDDTSIDSRSNAENNSKGVGVDKLRERLTSLTIDYKGRQIAILIDAVDQLFGDEWRNKLIFLPSHPNEKIEVVFSCLDDFTLDQISSVEYNIVRLKDLTKVEIELSIKSILKYLGRELENSVIKEIIAKPQATNPLYLSLLIQRLVMMDKHDFDYIHVHGDSNVARAEHKINVIHSISNTVEGACFDILNEASTRIGSDFTHTALEYIALSTNGLRESDLEEILEKQGLKWSSLEFSILTNYLQGFFLTRDDGRIDFTHRTIREGITCRCDNTEVKHQNIRNHLHTLGWSDPVSLDETVYQCFKADDKDYFVWYIEDIIKDDFYTGINSASKSLNDVINKNGIEWIESILNENYDKDLTKHFYKFVYIHLRPHFLHSTKKYEEIIKIMQSAAIRCSASADINSEEDVLLMADINFYLGDCFSDLSKYSLANQYFTDAIRLYEKIRDGNNPSAEKMLATVYNTYGLMMDAENKHEKALHYFDLALQIRERRGEYNQALCASYHNVAYHYYNVGDYQQALSYSRKSVEVIEKYALENEKDSAELMVTVYRRISLIYKALNRKEQGIAYIDKALRVAQKYIAFQPEVFEIKLGYIYNDKALILECAEHKNETIECYSNSIRIFEKYAEKFPEKYEETMATVICNLAGEYEKSADTYSLSEKMYVRGINIKEKILSSGLNSIAMSLATSYNNLGCLYLKQNKHGEARHYYLLAISTAMKSSGEELYFKRNTLSTFYRNASLIYKKLMMPIKAARYASYARYIDECKTFSEFDNYCSKKLLVSNRSFLLKKDDSIENIAGALLCEPKQVILIGDKRKQLERTKSLYQSVLVKNNIQTEISYRSVNKNNLQDIISTLEQVIEDCEDCVFDLTGGEELYLVAVGTIMERYKGRVQCHRFNFKNDTLNDCDADGNVSASKSFDISIEDNINIYGGEIVVDSQREMYTYPWNFSLDFEHDIDVMWDICRKNTRLWNAHVGTLGTICELFDMQDALSISFEKDLATSMLKQRGIKFVCVAWIMYELQKHGLVRSLVMKDTVAFVFKNEQVKQCLTIAGQILELVVAKTMRSIKDKNGAPLYHDVKVGVVIDWDRAEENEEYRTINEIDVVAMKGSIPIFISCKNGDFDANELYKLNTVAERFGNKYSKKVLISTELDKLGEKSDYIRARMDDMGIRNVENVDEMNDSELERALRSLWSN